MGNLKLQEVKLPSLDHTVVEVEINLKVSAPWDQQGKLGAQVPAPPQIVWDTSWAELHWILPPWAVEITEVSYASRQLGGIPIDSSREELFLFAYLW